MILKINQITLLLFSVCVCMSCIHSCLGQTFPDSWDKKRNLRGSNEQVLAWTHKTDTVRNFTYKTCITFEMREDSLGNSKYYIEEEYSNDKRFKNWFTGAIHYGPKPGEMLGFYDLHLESFETKPTPEEINALLTRWMYHLSEEGWVTHECGVDEELWMEHFGFVWQDVEVKTD